MSGVCGIFYRDAAPASASVLRPMLDAMPHRGPSHAGYWIDGSVALGCRLLRTTPESLVEELPLRHAGSGTVITADARIDNRDDLIARLRITGPPASIPDSEIILCAYECWGQDCVRKLLGDFAFAIWDPRDRTLFCARDHFGVRPFVYWLTDHVFAFASEINALLAGPRILRRLNEARVFEFLVQSFDSTESTFYQDIFRLPAAHTLAVDSAAHPRRRYWSLDPVADPGPPGAGKYADAFRSLFEDAVRCRLRGAVRVGADLSGGLDSSSVACMARDLRRGGGNPDLDTFSIIFDDVPRSDERSYIQAVLDSGGMAPHYVHGDRIGPLTDIDQVLAYLGEPFDSPNLFTHWAARGAARDVGVGIVLDGIDGDTVVSHGLGRLSELARAGRWPTLLREARAVSRRFDASLAAALHVYAVSPFVPDPLRVAWRIVRDGPSSNRHPRRALNPDFGSRYGISDQRTPRRRTEREAHLASLIRPVHASIFELVNQTSAFFSIETRSPFFDRRLVEFCLSLPADQKLRDGWSRLILREGMDGVLPPSIQWRGGKANLEHNFVHTLHGIDRERIEMVLRDDSDRLGAYLDVDLVRARWSRFLRRKTSGDGQAVLRAAILALWLQSAHL